MLAKLKFCFYCILVLLITTTAVVPSPVDDADSHKAKTGDNKTNSVTAADAKHETVSDAEVAQFLKDMRKLNGQVLSSNPSHDATDSSISSEASQPAETSAEAVGTKLDVMILLVIGTSAAGLLIILAIIVVAIFVCCKKGKCGKKDMSLNKDLNRWDPQLLRPTKANIDAFIFGSPIPSVAEMIKH